jgi:hypothetical protein
MRLQIEVFGWDKWATGNDLPLNVSIEAVIEALKDVLGTNELNQIRANQTGTRGLRSEAVIKAEDSLD